MFHIRHDWEEVSREDAVNWFPEEAKSFFSTTERIVKCTGCPKTKKQWAHLLHGGWVDRRGY